MRALCWPRGGPTGACPHPPAFSGSRQLPRLSQLHTCPAPLKCPEVPPSCSVGETEGGSDVASLCPKVSGGPGLQVQGHIRGGLEVWL